MLRITDVNRSQSRYRNRVVNKTTVNELWNKDFANGPVYLTQPGVYRLMEDIEFNPLPEFSSIFDSLASFPGGDHHFVLGYFAAIIINGRDIELDLNGFTMRQSFIHSLQQRFFALIELADRPFLQGQGPANFGGPLTPCQNIIIHNGTLGLSSHYGIHGNSMDNVTIRNLTIYNYEVAGISLNGAQNLTIDNVDIRHNYQHILVTALFSNAIYTAKKLMLKQRENAYTSIIVDSHPVAIGDVLSRLIKSINDAFQDIVDGNPIGTINPDSKIYDNSANMYLLDGNCYGIALNSTGLLVNEFKQTYDERNSNITLSNITITDIKSKPVEHLAITDTPLHELGLNPQTLPGFNKGAFGDVIRYFSCVDEQGKFTHQNNPLILAQIMGAVKVSDSLLTWVQSGSNDFYQRLQELTVLNNLDIMAHVFKGTNGIFISSGNNISGKNIIIKDIYNYSNAGQEQYVSRTNDYIGARVTGITIASSKNISFYATTIDNIYSECGQAIGVYHYGECGKITFNNCNIYSLKTGVKYHNPTSTSQRTKHGVKSMGYDDTYISR